MTDVAGAPKPRGDPKTIVLGISRQAPYTRQTKIDIVRLNASGIIDRDMAGSVATAKPVPNWSIPVPFSTTPAFPFCYIVTTRAACKHIGWPCVILHLPPHR